MSIKWLFLLFVLIFLSCNTVEPPLPPVDSKPKTNNSIKLLVDYSTLSSVNLKITKSISDTLHIFDYRLKRNGTVISQFPIFASDTTFLDDNNGQGFEQGILINYKIEAFKDTSSIPADTSNSITAEILKPTDNNFVFTIDTIANYGFLRGIWGLDKDNVWISGYDSVSNNYANIFKWNGANWLPMPNVPGEIDAIYGFKANQIIISGEFSNRGYIGMWDGSSWKIFNPDYFYSRGDTVYPLHGALWGSSLNDIWAGGFSGTLVHWDGTNWKKYNGLNLSKDFNFWDIWGFGSDCIYAVGNEYNKEVALFFYDGKEWIKKYSWPSYGMMLPSVWGPHKGLLYVTGYYNLKISNDVVTQIYLPNRSSVTNRVRGDAENNVFIVGDYGEIFHFNGISWNKIYSNYTDHLWLFSLQVFKNNIFSVGTINGLPIVIRTK